MKIKLDNYTFNPTAKTVTFTDYSSIDLSNIILITNVTDGTIIFNFASPNLVGSVAANVLTLNYDTTAMSSTDKLAIYLDDSYTPSSDEAIALLRRMVKLMEPSATQDLQQRQRVVVENSTITAIQGNAANLNANVGTVSTVTNIAGLGGVDPRFQFIDQARNAYANGIRANITNS
jgi:hypothetical protein